MALQVWLPLTKDLRQQGLSNVTVTNNGATYSSTGGKLGGCYSFDGTNDRIWTTGLNISGNAISICCWFKRDNSYTNEGYIISLNNGAGYADCEIGLDSTSSNIIGVAGGVNVTYECTHGEWYHAAVTYDKQNIKVYLNGSLLGTTTNTSSLTKPHFTIGARANGGNGGSGIAYPFKGQIQDVRLYDHCLSPMEVKQLSQGLILHYPLNNKGCGNDNLFNANNWEQTDTTVIEPITCGSMYVGQTSYLENKNQYLLPSGHGELIFSCDCETISINGASANVRIYSNSSTSYQILLKEVGFKQRVILNVPTAATKLYFGSWGYSGRVKLTNMKLEKGTEVTPYCPNVADESYNNIEYDCSGFCNNGTQMTTTITHTLDSAKYISSTHFNGTYDGIIIENFVLNDIINSAVTYAFWIKPESESGARSVYFGSYNTGPSWSIEKTTGNVMRSYWNGSPDETCSGATITDGVWQHICLTKNDTNDIKIYINGVQKWASTATHSNLNFPTTYRIGRDTRSNDGTPYKGLMSDFRIYATALSASDVKSLYQNCATIDPDGTIRGQIRS